MRTLPPPAGAGVATAVVGGATQATPPPRTRPSTHAVGPQSPGET